MTDEDIAGEQVVWLDARSLRSLVQSEIESTCRVWRNRQRAIWRKLKEARVKGAIALKRSTRDSAAQVRAKETIRSRISVGIGTVERFG